MLTERDVRAAFARFVPQVVPEIVPGIQRLDAAVLVPLRLAAQPAVVLTVRADTLRDHGGEVCFPGGKPCPGDRDLAATALREAHEEIGLDPARADVVGALSAIPTATSRYRVNPFVAVVREPPAPWVLSAEVARVLEVPIEAFATGAVGNFVTPFHWRDREVLARFFQVDPATAIFGATSYVLVDLFRALEIPLPEPTRVPEPAWAGPLLVRMRALMDAL